MEPNQLLKGFLRRYWTTLLDLRAWLRQPDPVENHEPVARFLTSKGHFSSQNARVKKGAFLPDKARETSVYRTEGMTLEDVWALGNRRITIWPKYRKFYGVGEITRAAVVIVKPVGLDVKPDRGPDGHANIVGWSVEKAEQLLQAQELANRAVLKLRT